MQNKITFFRFSKSGTSLDYSTKDEEKKEKANYERHRKNLEELPKIEYKKLNNSESLILSDYSGTKKQFKKELDYEESRLLDEIIDSNGCILKPIENHHPVIKKYYAHLSEKFDILELNKLIIQKAFNYNFEKANELKDSIDKTIPHERIEIQDINELNEIVKNMNSEGWSVKQIEGIQSGVSADWARGGYGYAFTEGIMIVWENNVAQHRI